MTTLGIKHPSFVRVSGWSAVDSGLEYRQQLTMYLLGERGICENDTVLRGVEHLGL
jgi:hypothetical protein